MKTDIHPTYYPEAKVTCACGNSFTVGSTKPVLEVEVCSNCHPFYTGQDKVMDKVGRVQKFKERMSKKEATPKKKAKKSKKATSKVKEPKKETLDKQPKKVDKPKEEPKAVEAKTDDLDDPKVEIYDVEDTKVETFEKTKDNHTLTSMRSPASTRRKGNSASCCSHKNRR